MADIDLQARAMRAIADLNREGWCIVPDALPAETIHRLNAELNETFQNTPFSEGHFYGKATKRFGRLLTRCGLSEQLVRHELLLFIAQQLLLPHCDCIQLNVAQAIAVHPGAPAQPPHRDQDMWQVPKGGMEYLLNIIWPLSLFREDNGATLVWPRSHGQAALEADSVGDPVVAQMQPGSALLFLGSTLHCAGANKSREERRAIVTGYSLGWLKPYENPWLAYPPSVARHFPADLAALVGYRQHRPNLGNFEGQCPSILLSDYAGEPLGAIDALRPDQQQRMDEFVRTQHAATP